MLLGCLGTKTGPFERALPWICARTRKCSGLVCGAHVSTEPQGTWSRQSRCWTGAESPLCETAPTSDRGGAFPGRALLKAGFLSVLLNFPFYWREAKRQNVLPCFRATSGSGKTAEDTGHQAEPTCVCGQGRRGLSPTRTSGVSSQARAAPPAVAPRAAPRARGSPAASPSSAQQE